ncbi:MAG: oligosaccharide flippase family protein, partial [Oscillospiraceae bacterium]|nr:oligosaccharide flippase family protein [Oscillospiraceae bacterium]
GGLLGLMGDNSELVCAAMALGMSGAEWLSMIASIVLYIYWGKKAKTPSFPEEKPTSLSALSRIALPDGLGAAARSVLLTAEHLLIPRGLRKSGENSQTALATYGTIHGMTLPLLLYPSALLSSLTGLIIPELARLRTEGKNLRIGGVSSRLIHWTLVFGLGTAACFYAFAPQLSAAIYGDFITVDSIRLLAPLIPAMFLDMCVDGILKGLDEQKSVMSYNVLDSALCVLMVLFLLPPMGVKGYYLILYAAELLNLTLSAARLLKVSDASVNIWESGVKSLLCAGAAWVIVQLLFAKTAAAMPAVMSAILLVSFMALIYMALINFFTRKGEKFADLVGIR